jgi:D-beta-D-heptose 7-phosphate kinase/D-beta-D-heptose 1-phosphate adenosyltransferase
MGRVVDWQQAAVWRKSLAEDGKQVVFTNGVFDLIHTGHIELLEKAAAFGDALVVGINSDASVIRLKGSTRPFVGEQDRSRIVAALQAVDLVVIFEEDTPAQLIQALQPDILVKGADYALDDIVGRETVEANGGRVERVQLVEGRSTSDLVNDIVNRVQMPKAP